VHVAEDLLGAIRAEQLVLDSQLVDELLASLDQIGIWIDQMEEMERLSEDADGISSAMAKSLRSHFRSADPPSSAAPQERAAATAVDSVQLSQWLGMLSEDERFEAFGRIADNASVVLVHYRPAEDCFFKGTDPLNLMLMLPAAERHRRPVTPFCRRSISIRI